MRTFSRIRSTDQKTWQVNHPEHGRITFFRSDRSRSLKLSVKPFLGLQVKLPPGWSTRKALVFIREHGGWIRKATRKVQETEKLSRHFFDTQPEIPRSTIRQALTRRLDDLARQCGFSYQRVSIRNQKSRWGSCSANNNISLNQKLYYLPADLRDYVLLHELAHTIQKDHSQNFWSILYQILGQDGTRQARQELKKFDYLFHRPLDSI